MQQIIQTKWHSLSEIFTDEYHNISAIARIHSDSPWFEGHFPGNPIVPGIAQLGIVFELIQNINSQKLKIESIKRVRFRTPLRPDMPIRIEIRPDKDKSRHYAFRIIVKDVVACRGLLVTQTTK